MIDLTRKSASGLLTNSRLNSRATCNRKEYFEYTCLVRPERSDALRIGGMFHDGIEMAKARTPMQGLYRAIDKNYAALIEKASSPEHVATLEAEAMKVKCMVFAWSRLYLDHIVADGIGPCDVIANELEFELPIFNPDTGRASKNWRLAGKIDAIVRRENGKLSLLEHKTTSESLAPESDYWTRLRIDQQITLYMYAARRLGFDVVDTIYDVVHVPNTSPKMITETDADGRPIVVDNNTGERAFKKNGDPYLTAGRPDHAFKRSLETVDEYGSRILIDMQDRPAHYFARTEVTRTQSDIDEFVLDLWGLQKQMSWSYLNFRHPKNTAACRFPYRCKYLSACASQTDLTRVVPDGFVKLTTAHPELEESTSDSE